MSFEYASAIFTLVVSLLAIALSVASLVLARKADRRAAAEARRRQNEED